MSKAKGSRSERKAVKLLEARGYACTKAGGSLGLFDIIALGPSDVRCVQVKSGTARLSRGEREAIEALQVPASVSKEYWLFRDYARAPVIENL
jgi:Holliday junction resolvase